MPLITDRQHAVRDIINTDDQLDWQLSFTHVHITELWTNADSAGMLEDILKWIYSALKEHLSHSDAES